MEAENLIGTGLAEETTNVRATACADPRNAVSLLAACHLMLPLTDYRLIINGDATQMEVGYKNKNVFVKYLADDGRPTLKAMPNKGDSGLTSFFIKYYLIMTAGGFTSNPIYIIADKDMKKDEIDVHSIPGFGIGTDLTAKGYVIFCSTRQLNENFFRWININIIIPFVRDIREMYSISTDHLAWYQVDGENV